MDDYEDLDLIKMSESGFHRLLTDTVLQILQQRYGDDFVFILSFTMPKSETRGKSTACLLSNIQPEQIRGFLLEIAERANQDIADIFPASKSTEH
jgi:hypothetical protein